MKKTSSRPVHFRHYQHAQYLHTYCGLINFVGYRAWPFTRTRANVTCKRCLGQLERDERAVSYKTRLAEWASRRSA